MNTSNNVNEDLKTKNEMEKMVPKYDSYMKKITFGRENILRELTVNLAQVKTGDSVLEVGCGTGTLTLAAKRKAGPTGKVYGIDVLPGMIELSQRKAVEANEEITFQSGSIDDIPFNQNQFDVVMCSFMIFHMPDEVRRKGITEIYRVLKPNGRLFILDLVLPTQPIQKAIAKLLLGFALQNKLEELIPEMQSAGFSDVSVVPVKFSILGLSIVGGVTGITKKS
jgi:ubiquinone/menaquinone biosynthesis C-methylase UbiE